MVVYGFIWFYMVVYSFCYGFTRFYKVFRMLPEWFLSGFSMVLASLLFCITIVVA